MRPTTLRRACALIAVALAASACAAAPAKNAPVRVVATPYPTPVRTVSPTVKPTPAPTAAPTPEPKPVIRAAPKPIAKPPAPTALNLAPFQGLGTWIDVFDHTDDPASIIPLVRSMRQRGTQTLYLESSRYKEATDIKFPRALGAALDEAKRLGMYVVAWYPPAFGDPGRDLRRSLAAIRFRSPGGNTFDAFGADIEYPGEVADAARRSALAVEYSRQLRAAVGPNYLLAAIVIPPTALDRAPERWQNFPWAGLAPHYQVFMPMGYWTGLGKNAQTAGRYTAEDTRRTKALTGRPVHTIGGLGADTDDAQADAYAKALIAQGSIGGSLYDYTTTRSTVWDELAILKR